MYIISIFRTLAKAVSLGPSKNLATVALPFLAPLLVRLHRGEGPYLGSFAGRILW